MSEFVPGESIVQRVNVAVLIHFPPVCEKVRNFRFPENPRVEKKRGCGVDCYAWLEIFGESRF